MSISYFCKERCRFLIFLIILTFNSGLLNSQIIVYERPTNPEQKDIGLFFESDTRKKIDLNGQWEISFNDGKSYDKFIVPIAYDFNGTSIYKRKFIIPEDILSSYSFILVAEGIDYECEIRINNNFISNHTGGYTPVISVLSDGTVSGSNEIMIVVNSGLNYKNTVPLSDQINYSKVYAGITKDIYLIAVPKLFVLNSSINYSVDNLLSVKVRNTIDIKSSNLYKQIDTAKAKDLFIQTVVIRKSNNAGAGQSEKIKFTIGENNTVKSVNEFTVSNPVLWTPELPELYIIKSIITDNTNRIIDESIDETGFTNLTIRNNQIFNSGRQIRLNGINYYEDMPKFAAALDYKEVEKDLMNIKALGFNALRVPGRCAHPYIVNICDRVGLFLLQEIPLNETDGSYLEKDKYVRLNLNYLADIIERDKNSPCIFAWGIGNDFDVSQPASLAYVKSAVSLIDSVNKRFTYYTSRAYNQDLCSEAVDFVGINFYGNSYEQIKNILTDITNRTKPLSNRKNTNLFVSAYGLNIENGNSNGFSDIKSQEAQMKFLNECYPKISQLLFGNFISSYADWNSENPLNYPLDKSSYLKTNGLYTFNREQKRSVDFVKRILNNEDIPRIQEGNYTPDFPYAFIITGLVVIFLLIYFINRDKKFRSSLMRCLYKPSYFYSLVKDQMIISNGYNLILTLSISIGLALFFSSIIYYYNTNNSFDIILAKLFSNDSTKKTISNIVNNKFYLILSLTIMNFILTFLTAFILYFISFYTKGKSFFKNIYTVCIWSTLPMLIFLFIGTIIYKLAENNPVYIKLSLWLFIILYFLYLNRIIVGAKSLFDIRTGKVYLYGVIIIFFLFAIIYSYFLFFTGVIETMHLISHLTA
ncbi:MAG: glycoside hydrolase family 2 TIM barrel-domain containing protein [bacterium]